MAVTATPADPVVITGGAMLCSLGDADQTFSALLDGRAGLGPLRHVDPAAVGVAHGYHVPDSVDGDVGSWLAAVIADAVAQAGLDTDRRRVAVLVGTGLRELRGLERSHADGVPFAAADLHFGAAVRSVLPGATEVLTLSNACSASGFALGLGMDMLALDEADAVVVAGCDGMTESMLAVIGRVAVEPSERVQPFEVDRRGVLLGEGAVAVVIQRESADPLARVLSVGMACDAFHETAPHPDGVVAAVRDAHSRAGRLPGDIDLVVAHATGTALNDPTESAALTEVFGSAAPDGLLVTGIKGATGHTSGGAALMSLLVAVRALRTGTVPPVVGLRTPIPEAEGLRLVIGEPCATTGSVAQVNAFGFGGVNAVTLVEV
ncbi:beta-ketoacyl synthase [Actinokineospora sp. PR83]|uniref:beta-ketoacyl synthase N-terminal-like domain-containing protein n=1 Tax=Actinokineospora sp. PR83 TaxID=2884908 RepID=UPI0027DEBB48|nr:beta-ketoacyl synthase N-terminal-like domain-containing protein [Actinokineospora sp. PR83]MCG8914801.1 beta-ketoacyl synthase [Actinokineospora sp. PR83]